MPRRAVSLIRSLLVLCGLLAGWLPLPVVAQAPPPAPTPLHVVSDDNYPPYLFKGPDGQAQGYLVDWWALWSQTTGVPVTLTATEWSRAQQMLQDGQADVIDMIFRTPARESLYHFSPAYADVPVSIYAHESVRGIRSVQGLAGFRIGVQEGDACIERLRLNGVTDVVTYPNYQRIIDAAVGQQIKLFCMDQYPGDHYLYRNQLHKDYPKAFDLYVGQFHRAVRRDHAATLAQVEAGIARLDPQAVERLQAKWLKAPTDWRAIGHQLLLAAAVVVVGTLVLLLWVRSLRRAVRERTAELQRERTRLNVVMRAIPDLVWLKDPEGVYLGCNRAFEGLYGAPEAGIVGKTDRDFVDEASAASFRHHDRLAMDRNMPSVNEEWLTFADDGRRRLFETVKAPLRDADGTLIGVLGVARDITDRKQAAQELERLRHQLQELVAQRTAQLERTTESLKRVLAEQTALFQAAPVGIALLRNRQVEQCNPQLEAIFGYGPGEMLGMATRQWYLDDPSYEHMGTIYPQMMAGEQVAESLLMRRRDGEVFWARIRAQAIDPKQPEKGVLALIEDATADHEAEQALRLARDQAEAAMRLKSAFLANISHEVRTPLNAILGMAHLASESSDAAERREHLRQVQQAGRHLLRLFNDILALSRFEAGQVERTRLGFDLPGVLNALCELHQPRATQRGLQLRLELAPDVPTRLVGDGGRLGQLLTLYLDNALKFADHGEVRLRVLRLDQLSDRVQLRFEVVDSGPGLGAEQLKHVFEPFQQGDLSLSRRHGGLGLGLALARQMALLMDGDVGADSTPGQGSCFWFRAWWALPDARDAAAHQALRVPGRRALVASAESGHREALLQTLRGFGVDAEAALSGPDAVRHVVRADQTGQPLDFVLLDADLPEVDGWHTAPMLAALDLPHPPHLLLLAPGDNPPAPGPLPAGVARVLPQHLTPSTLWDAMAALLSAPATPRPAADAGGALPPPTPGTGDLLASDAELDGVDLSLGLQRCGGQPGVYRQLLAQFQSLHAATRAHLLGSDAAELLRTVHQVHAQAQSLGATRLQALAAGLEQQLAAQTPQAFAQGAHAAALQALLRELTQLADAVPRLMAALPGASPSEGAPAEQPATGADAADAPGASEAMAAIETALRDGDMEAVRRIAQHRDLVDQHLGARRAAFDQAMAQFDFDTALALLRPAG